MTRRWRKAHTFTLTFEVPASEYANAEVCLQKEKQTVLMALRGKMHDVIDSDDEYIKHIKVR